MTNQDILVLGGAGFIGRCLVDRLVAQGRKVCVPTRRRAAARSLWVLPSVEVVEADVGDAATLARLLAGRDAVINLVGILHGTDKQFAAAHVELPRALVAACQAQGVKRLLHVSALGADPQGPSAYLRSKGEGERIVRAAPLAWTVLRPSVVFGEGDSFLALFARLARWLPLLPIGGGSARMQPVWVQDLVTAMCSALDSSLAARRSYEVCGPTVYTLAELVRFAARASGHPRAVISLPGWAASAMARLFALLPVPAPFTPDDLRTLSVDSVASSQPYQPAPELAFRPAPLEPEAALYLSGLHPRTRFDGFRARARR